MLYCYKGVRASLRSLGSVFKEGMLAYLALTSKSERELCGALAWRLHAFYGEHKPYDLVGREIRYQNARCDVSIVSRAAPQNPKVLIEAKAAYLFEIANPDRALNPDLIRAVLRDVAKLRKLVFDGERYVLVFFTYPRGFPDTAVT